MDKKTKWIDRRFKFDFPQEEYPSLLERLGRCADRLEALISALPESIRVRRHGESWSIQENAGHLKDTDLLFIARLEDFRAGKETLVPAEMTGRKTFEARHNESDLETLLSGFRKQREEYLTSLEALSPEVFGRSAMHPRLKKPMRLCDMLYFQAEHDDYHISLIEELIKRFTPRDKDPGEQ